MTLMKDILKNIQHHYVNLELSRKISSPQSEKTHWSILPSLKDFSHTLFLAELGKARGCSTNTVVIH